MCLNFDEWKTFVPTDEAILNLGDSCGRRCVCYICKGHGDPSKLKYVKSEYFAPGFFAWALVSSQAKLRLRLSLKVSSQFEILYRQSFETIH